MWKNGELDSQNGMSVKWDLQSVNTCPENFKWKQQTPSFILVEVPGLYEVSVGFFTKKKRPLIQVYANDDLLLEQHHVGVGSLTNKENGSTTTVQKGAGGIHRVSALEYVALPANARITVSFSYSSKSGGTFFLTSAEGFIGLRKL